MGRGPLACMIRVAFVILLLGNGVAGWAACEASSGRAANGTLPIVGVYLRDDVTARSVDIPWLQGSQMHVGWAQLEAVPGVFDFAVLDSWLTKLANGGRKGVFGVWLRCQDNSDGEDACAPGWALAWDPVMAAGRPRLNYLDPQVQQALRELVTALAQRYARDQRVAYIEIGPGFAGTSSPCPTSLAVPDRAAQYQAYEARYGPSSDAWEKYTTWLIRLYGEQFRAAGGSSHVPLQAVTTGKYRAESERAALVEAALQAGSGLHDLELAPDFRIGERLEGRCAQDWWPEVPGYNERLAYQAHWVPLERLWRVAPVSFRLEGWRPDTEKQLEEEEYLWWSVLNALDKHASAIQIPEDTLEWPQPWHYFQRYAGRDARTTPDVWIAFRGHRAGWCPDTGDYEWFLYRREDAVGGSQAAYGPEQGRTGKGWQAMFGRGTDVAAGNPSLYLDIDDEFLYGGQWVVQVDVTYWDGTAEMAGLSWELAYDATGAPGQVAGTVTLTGTDRWLVQPFVLTDATFMNRLPDASGRAGSDLRLSATGKGDVRFHMVRIRKLTGTAGRGSKPESMTTASAVVTPEVSRRQEGTQTRQGLVYHTPKVEASQPGTLALIKEQAEPSMAIAGNVVEEVGQEVDQAYNLPEPMRVASLAADADLVLLRAEGGFRSVRDTFLDASQPRRAHGASNVLLLKGDESTRVLLAFDLSSVPRNSRVVNAWLEVTVVGRNAPGPMIVWLLEVRHPWDDRQATWELSAAETPWTAPGLSPEKDYSVQPVAGVLLPAQGMLQIPLTELVQRWVAHPEANHGILLAGQGEATLEYYLFSSEWRQAELRPRLRVRLADDKEMLAAQIPTAGEEPDSLMLGWRRLIQGGRSGGPNNDLPGHAGQQTT